MVDSRSLQLALATAAVRDRITDYVAAMLTRRGYRDVSPAMLNFLGALDCGVNYASEIARNLNVSRQMVAKTVRELGQAGYLEQQRGSGKQKQILFTAQGERLMSDVRQCLAELDAALGREVSARALNGTVRTLEAIASVVQGAKAVA
jgi:DNA-binding MarR family transcriptional regulator